MSYRNLIKDLRGIVDSGLLERKEDFNLANTYTNWELGKRLVTEEKEDSKRAAYGKKTLEKIAIDLKNLYGRGYGVANLHYMGKFYQLYKKPELSQKLSWSHYRLLVQVKDKVLRKQLERRIVKNNWGYRDLLYQIQKSSNVSGMENEVLERPFGILGIHQVRRVESEGRAFLDLGFKIWIEAERLEGLESRQLVTAKRHGKEITIDAYEGERSALWLYKAYLDHVVDGDTLVVYIDFNLGVLTQQILRLRSINASPLSDSVGIKARNYLQKKLEKSPFMLIKTRQRDKYDRYVADVVTAKHGQSDKEALESGLFLNQSMLEKELATRAL